MGDVDERRVVVYGLTVDEVRECLGRIAEERVQHDALHGIPNPTVEGMVNLLWEELDKEERRQFRRLHDDEVRIRRNYARKLADGYSDEKVHEQLLVDLDEFDEHWRTEHPEEPEPGVEYLGRAVNDIRRPRYSPE